ncbi:MAG: hypothetical protein V4539_23745 [Bacteroidota bacterium]
MAKQFGQVSLIGTVGDTTYTRTSNGFRAGQRSRLNKNSILTSPRFARLREHMEEFGRAGKAGKMVREHLNLLIGNCKDTRMSSRLTTLMLTAVQMDKVNPLGQRNVLDGELSVLEKFEFNSGASLVGTLAADVSGDIDRSTGQASVQIAAFVPEEVMKYSLAASHYRISIGAAVINFEDGTGQRRFTDGPYLPVGKEAAAAQSLAVSLPTGLTDPILLALKLEFFTEVNGYMNGLRDSSYGTCSILKVDTGV